MSFQLSWPLPDFAQEIGASIGNLPVTDLSKISIRDVAHSLTPDSLNNEPIAVVHGVDTLISQALGQVSPNLVVSAEPLEQTVANQGNDVLNNLPLDGQLVSESKSEDLISSSQVSTQGFFDNFFRRTVATFDLNADLTDEDSFCDLPCPFNLR